MSRRAFICRNETNSHTIFINQIQYERITWIYSSKHSPLSALYTSTCSQKEHGKYSEKGGAMDNRERATQFVASLPKFEGIQRISPTDPERYKVYKDLIDKLEKEFDEVRHRASGLLPRESNPSWFRKAGEL